MTTMMHAVSCSVLCFATSCGALDHINSSLRGGGTKTCVDGVTYLQFASVATVHVDRSPRESK